ncbi:MAG: hypothetical protein L0Z53_10055 [Acidobacteriales bacterium]|nr:hypothetical protein [Terriglobales bacterium]
MPGSTELRRPESLAEVSAWTREARDFEYHLADFLDQFDIDQDLEMLRAEPDLLAERLRDSGVADAYLAATAVSLARLIGKPPPTWALAESRKLRQPWFAHPGAAIRATLLAESPAPFRERNLFVSENALSRA